MIDTVILTIPKNNFKILRPSEFSERCIGIFNPPYRKGSFVKDVRNPTKAEKESGKYYPRLTLIKALRRGGFSVFLKVEFSASKLLFGNNFDELEETDFYAVCKTLEKRLEEMGIILLGYNTLENCSVSGVHYSKNIALTDYSTPYSITKELKKCDISKLKDVNQTDFRNEGHVFKYRTNSKEIVFYDKRKDLEIAKISEKRAEEKDYYGQLNLFSMVKPKSPFEVIRLEIRLNTPATVRKQLAQLEINLTDRLTFRELFNESISKRVLLEEINYLNTRYLDILLMQENRPEDVVTSLRKCNPHLSYGKILMFTAAKVLLESVGVREFREITKSFGYSNWYRLNKEIRELNLDQISLKATNPFVILNTKIGEFKPLKMVDFL